MNQLINIPIHVEKRTLGWYDFAIALNTHPAFTLNLKNQQMYGMPCTNNLFKLADMNARKNTINTHNTSESEDLDQRHLDALINHYLHYDVETAVKYAVCKYTLTKDNDFIIDRHPQYDHVLIFSPCSGHGFKYAPLYGNIAESFITDKEQDLKYLNKFKLSRFNAIKAD